MSLRRSLLPLMAASLLVACSAQRNQVAAAEPSGADLFRLHCASCHGENARGNGPVAPFLAVAVPDLTRIGQRHGGRFAPLEVFKSIDGQAPLPCHGTRNMPVWGYEFFGPQSDDRLAHLQATERVERLVSYLGTLQRTD